MPEKKSNHFLPKMYLKNFTDVNLVYIYDCEKQKLISSKPLSYLSQNQKDYFYGKNNGIEDYLGDLETKTSIIFSKIINDSNALETLTDNERSTIYEFISLLNVRTNKQCKSANNMVKSFKSKIKEKDCDTTQVDHILNAVIEPSLLINIGKKQAPIFYDLKMILIENKSNIDFITTDSPLIKYNFYLEPNIYKITSLGIADQGIIILLPISPQKMLCLIDESKYLFSKNTTSFKITDDDIIKNINTNIILNSDKLLFMYPTNTIDKQEKWATKILKTHIKPIEKCDLLVSPYNEEILHLKYEPADCRLKLPFIKLKQEFAKIPIQNRTKTNRASINPQYLKV